MQGFFPYERLDHPDKLNHTERWNNLHWIKKLQISHDEHQNIQKLMQNGVD